MASPTPDRRLTTNFEPAPTELTVEALGTTMRDELSCVGRILEDHENKIFELTRMLVQVESRQDGIEVRLRRIEDTLTLMASAFRATGHERPAPP